MEIIECYKETFSNWVESFYHNNSEYGWNTLLKPKRHSLRCHDFVVHALLLRMHTNVVDFRVIANEIDYELTMREPTFMGSMTTDHVITACDV